MRHGHKGGHRGGSGGKKGGFGLAAAPGGAANTQNYPTWGADAGRPGMAPPAPRPSSGPGGMAVPVGGASSVGLSPGGGASGGDPTEGIV